MKRTIIFIFSIIILASCSKDEVSLSGELKTWHRMSLEVPGPNVSEYDVSNPFLDIRLDVEFTKGDQKYMVPGYFAADGNAGESGAQEGSVWKAHFAAPEDGEWLYKISFRRGKDIVLASDVSKSEALQNDGVSGSFIVEKSDKTGRDFRSKGRLEVVDGNYLQHKGTKEYFLKAGVDSPENLLGYADFDATYYGGNNKQRAGEDTPNAGLHAYEIHEQHWNMDDPFWRDGKGKGIIGGMNYLASKGVNSAYFLTMNIQGDGDDVWPYTDRNERYRFDCSKLDQWEVLFSHMDSLGIMMHVVLQETENENILDGGYLEVQRKLYLRELVARFAHHNAITWNLGEEHGPVNWGPYGQTAKHTMQMADYLREIDPYDHFIVVHTHPDEKHAFEYVSNFLGHPSINGPSIQTGNPLKAHRLTKLWLEASAEAGQPWVVCLDEIGPANKGALPDAIDPEHDTIRKHVLWANLMAGGAGVEWYFGYKFAHADLNCEDWTSRDRLYEQSAVAVDFFQNNLPFNEMKSCDELVDDAYCFAKPGELYVVYSFGEQLSEIDLTAESADFTVQWFNPREGGDLQMGSVGRVESGGKVDAGEPEGYQAGDDWVCVLKLI